MKILIDIGHPAHVHYFRNFITEMKKRGHNFFITARNKDVTFSLLNAYNIPYISRDSGSSKLLGKLLYIFKADYLIFKHAVNFKPDIFLSFGSTYAGHVAFFLKKPHIVFDDTEHAKLEHLMYKPFANIIFTPNCFLKDMGKKQIRFQSFMELCYLHPKYYSPNPTILKSLNIKEQEEYAILRFVSWDASHDIGQTGLSYEMKIEVVSRIASKMKVFISSENELPADLKKYKISIEPEIIHDALYYASIFVGEGATMASECAMLGTPAIYVNSLTGGTVEEQEVYGLLFGFRTSNGVLEKIDELLNMKDRKIFFREKNKKLIYDKIDITEFLIWFIEEYPNSHGIMKMNPDYQSRFI